MLIVMFGSSNAYADDAVKKILSISASYKGGSLLVGTEYDIEDLEVTAYYENGTSEVVTDYSTGSRIIARDGENKFAVVYKGKADTFTVTGKTVKEINAYYTGGEHSVGNKINSKEVVVRVTYSDYSTETLEEGYTLTQAVISKAGNNEVIVVYSGKRASFTVIGTAAKMVESVYVSYLGGARVLGAAVREEDIMLTALYTDGTTELIYNYTISPSAIQYIGVNNMTISFKGKSDKFVVEGIQKIITGITAKYTGGTVTVGRNVRLSDIVVTATYNDGSVGTETEFNIVGGGKVPAVGNNVMTIDAQGQKADITVIGIAASAADFNSAPSYQITNGRRTGTVGIDIPSGYFAKDIAVESIDSTLVKRLLTREIRSGDYIPFTIQFVDLDLDAEVPMTVQITLPSDYNVKGCSVYFTPNRKSVIARMNAEIVDDKYLQFVFFHEGTYIISYNFDWEEETVK